MSDRPETSAVRDAAALIGAAEELLDLAPDPKEAATYIGTIADAAKALRANHLADALEHVHYRAGRLADTRPSGSLLEPVMSGWPDGPVVVNVAGSHAQTMAQAAEALRLTAEYVGPDGLPAIDGWSWWDALQALRHDLGWDRLPADWRDPSSDEEEPSSEAAARDARHEAAVDALVDPEELRARVHGDD